LIQKFAKAGFRILDLPRHDGPPRVNDMTSHLTSQLKRGGSNQKSRGETRKQRRSVWTWTHVLSHFAKKRRRIAAPSWCFC